MEIRKSCNELVLWHEFDGPGDISINVLEKICRMYSERNNITITPVVKNIYEITRFFQGEPRGTGLPHMAFLPSDLVMLAYKGNFSVVPDNIYKYKINESALKTMSFDGKQFGLPVIGGNHLLLYYNKDILPSGIFDWEELNGVVDELLKKQITPISLDLYQLYWILPILSAFGAWPIEGLDPNNINFDSVKQAFCFISSMVDKGILESCVASTEMLEKFFEGKIGAIIAGEWSYSYIMKNMREKAGVCRIPSIGGRKCTSTTSTLGLVYTGHSLETEFRDYLLGFGEFMLSEECQMMWLQEVDRIPLNIKISKKINESASGNRRVVLKQMYDSHPLLVSSTSENMWAVLELGKELFWHKSFGIDEVIERMKEKVRLLNVS